jgi:hypothetical protein
MTIMIFILENKSLPPILFKNFFKYIFNPPFWFLSQAMSLKKADFQ